VTPSAAKEARQSFDIDQLKFVEDISLELIPLLARHSEINHSLHLQVV
jgi:hypothetical protein